MSYVATVWENGKEPSLSADNLNKIEGCLVEVMKKNLIDVVPMGVSWGAGKIAKFSHSCMFDVEFRAPISTGGSTDIFQFPDGFRPYIEFGVPVINTNDFSYVGIAEYDVARNMVTFRSNVQDSVMCRISLFYVTTDTDELKPL